MVRRLIATFLERAAHELLRAAARVHPMPLPKEDRTAPLASGFAQVRMNDESRRMVEEGMARTQPGLRPDPKAGPLKGSAAWRAQQGDR